MTNSEDQIAVLQDCVSRFDKLGVAYMLTGSMALVRYAMPRMTVDIDVVVEISPIDADKIISEFEPDYYVPHGTLRDAVARRTIFNLLHQTSLVKIDCVICKTDEFQKHIFARRERVDYAGFDVWIINREDLILAKLKWAQNTRSETQLRDVAGIWRNGCDENYVREWAQKLGVNDLLKTALATLEK